MDDSFSISGGLGGGSPVICGTNTGYHSKFNISFYILKCEILGTHTTSLMKLDKKLKNLASLLGKMQQSNAILT